MTVVEATLDGPSAYVDPVEYPDAVDVTLTIRMEGREIVGGATCTPRAADGVYELLGNDGAMGLDDDLVALVRADKTDGDGHLYGHIAAAVAALRPPPSVVDHMQVTLTRHEIATLSDITYELGVDPVLIEQRIAPQWTITRALLPDGSKLHLGYEHDAPKWADRGAAVSAPKYELVSDDTVTTPDGRTLHRIRALRPIRDTVGDLGGYVEAERNLSHDGDCWVFGDARVYGDAEVYGHARVFGDARVYGHAEVYGDARVYKNARVYGHAWVYENARVYGDAWMYGHAEVFGDAEVYGHAEVFGDAWVYENARVFGDAWVYENARVYGHAEVSVGKRTV